MNEAERYFEQEYPHLKGMYKDEWGEYTAGEMIKFAEAYANQSKLDVSDEMNAIEYAKTHHLENHLITYERLAEMLTDFANQSKPDVSDEEIFNASSHLKYREHQIAYKSGAKWMRDKINLK